MPMLRYRIGDRVAIVHDEACECDLGSELKITTPIREHSSFVLAAVNIDPLPFEETIYAHPEVGDTVTDYQLRLIYDPTTGRDVLTVLIASSDSRYVGAKAHAVTSDTSAENLAVELGHQFIEANEARHFSTVINEFQSAEFNVQIRNDIEVGSKKPVRVVDTR